MDKHSTLDPVMVSVVSSNPTEGNFWKFFKPLDVNFGLKCRYDLIVKNSTRIQKTGANYYFLKRANKWNSFVHSNCKKMVFLYNNDAHKIQIQVV